LFDYFLLWFLFTIRDDPSIQEYGLWTLYNLCIASSEIATMIKSKGILELCQIAIENHSKNEKIMKQIDNIKAFFNIQTLSSSSSLPENNHQHSLKKKKK
jgi:hypothetical protein